MRNALSLLGVEGSHITGPDTHPAAIVSWAAGTTIPLGVDDIRSAKKAESIAVQFLMGLLTTPVLPESSNRTLQ